MQLSYNFILVPKAKGCVTIYVLLQMYLLSVFWYELESSAITSDGEGVHCYSQKHSQFSASTQVYIYVLT